MVFSLRFLQYRTNGEGVRRDGKRERERQRDPLTAVSETRVIRVTAIPDESRRCESVRNQPKDEL